MMCYCNSVANKQDEQADAARVTGAAARGVARAAKLTPERRSEIARNAAQQRWKEGLLQAVAGDSEKPLRVNGIDIECFVLEDGTRVLTQRSFNLALGKGTGGSGVSLDGLPPFLATRSLAPYITDEIREKAKPVDFITPSNARGKGYRAELLPIVCKLYLDADDAGTLASNQKHIAAQANILIRGLAEVGILALVDEATGYQEVRARDALAKILEEFIAKELAPWVRTFPADFYKEMFRLRGLEFPAETVRRPQYFGMLTNDIVYKRLAPGVLDELKRVQEKGDTGKPKHKLFQKLTSNAGYPKLREHLGSIVTLMKISDDWDGFKAQLDRIHPKYDDTIPINYDQPGL